MKKYTKKAFTLVELVIVAVILAILATVGFISYEDYLVDTRDSKRLSQLAGLRDSLRLQTTKGKLPLPDDSVEIRNNATPFLYQGYAGEQVLETLSYSDTTFDPYDEVYYTYLLSRNRKDFQLMGFLEKYNKDVISFGAQNVHANVDYSQRYPNVFGKKLGILLQQETNTPLQEIPEYTSSGYLDIRDSTSNVFDAYVTDTFQISGKESDLLGIIPYTTCKKIKETGGSYGNGIYNVNPSGLSPLEVYCNMEIDGGGWTLVGRSYKGAALDGSFGWMIKSGTVYDNASVYSLGSTTKDLNFSEIMLSSYTVDKKVDYAIKLAVDASYIRDETNYTNYSRSGECSEVYPTNISWKSACDAQGVDGKTSNTNFTKYWGYINLPADKTQIPAMMPTNRFFFRTYTSAWMNGGDSDPSNDYDPNFGLSVKGYIAGDSSYDSFGIFQPEGGVVKQGMIFVR